MDKETQAALDMILQTLKELNLSIIKVNSSLKELQGAKKDELFL